MTDKELLEAAARAAGLTLDWESIYPDWPMSDGRMWNALRDDGDALRLAVKLGLVISPWGGTVYINKPGRNPIDTAINFGPDGDQYAATRRAIVCAAAEIGSLYNAK